MGESRYDVNQARVGDVVSAEEVQRTLEANGDPEKAIFLQRFFKTGKGEYAEGDRFRGIKVPVQRQIAKTFAKLPDDELIHLLQSPWHEDRLTALIIWVNQSKKASATRRQEIMSKYLSHTAHINNWDLVDVSAPDIVGACVPADELELLFHLANSTWLWDKRIAMLATLWHIRKGEVNPAFAMAGRFIDERHDLMQKAVGWMLREAGKKQPHRLRAFLRPRCGTMPRTMLRYAIEHFPEEERQSYLKNAF